MLYTDQDKGKKWFAEFVTSHDVYHHEVFHVLCHERTRFQEMHIIDCGVFGKSLVLDGQWQSSLADEFLYHEPLVHPACVNHGGPRRVLVLGGGEGAAVREVLKWKTVEQVVMVDIDQQVVAACRQHLPEMHRGALDDPRTTVVIDDALHFIDRTDGGWDVIISDLSDPIDDGPSFMLFTREYFEKCRRLLARDGILAVQAGSVAPYYLGVHAGLANTVASVFPFTTTYCSAVPAYCDPWGYVMAGSIPLCLEPVPRETDRMLGEKTTGEFRMFDGRTLVGLMHPPKHIRDAVAAETRVFTLEAPPNLTRTGVA